MAVYSHTPVFVAISDVCAELRERRKRQVTAIHVEQARAAASVSLPSFAIAVTASNYSPYTKSKGVVERLLLAKIDASGGEHRAQ